MTATIDAVSNYRALRAATAGELSVTMTGRKGGSAAHKHRPVATKSDD